jgi:hypothetical protein
VKRLAAYGEPVEGTPFGRYRLVELLGRGGKGEMWRVYRDLAGDQQPSTRDQDWCGRRWLPTTVPKRRPNLPRILQGVGLNLVLRVAATRATDPRGSHLNSAETR